jgi:hypothetical protein
VQVETELEILLEDNKENVKSEAKSPKVKALSEEEPSFTTVSKEELSERSAEAQQKSWSPKHFMSPISIKHL